MNTSVSDATMDEFYREVTEAGLEVSREDFEAAREPLRRQLGYEITQTEFNEQTARQRANAEDPQVQIAVEILRQATDPMSVFAIGDRIAARHAALQPGTRAASVGAQ